MSIKSKTWGKWNMFEKQRNLNLQQRGCLDHDKIILCVANTRYIHHAWCVLFALKIFMRQFFRIKYPYAREFKVVQNKQNP